MERKMTSRSGSGSGGGGRKDKSFGGKRSMKRRDKKDDVLTARMRKKTCRFCDEKIDTLDYKDIKRLERLVSERGKILSRRVTGVCAGHQRKVGDVIKKARLLALLPFLNK